jgi:two-component system NtrC family sensor kinase
MTQIPTQDARAQQAGAQERLLRSVVDSLDARMCILSDQGSVVGTNLLWDEFSAAMGWHDNQAGVGADFYALAHLLGPELEGTLTVAIGDVLAGRTEQSTVKGHLTVDARGEDVVVRVHPVHGHEDAAAVVTMIDITGATRIQRELRRVTDEAQLLALVAQHTTDNAVVIADVEGQIEWVNETFCRMTGYTSEEVLGRRRHDLITGPFARTPAVFSLGEALSSGTSTDVQFRTQTKGGRSYWVHIQVQPIIEDGRLIRFVSVERDITKQRAAEEQLRASTRKEGLLAQQMNSEKALLNGVLASIPDLVFWKDDELRYTGVNPAFLALRGLADEADVLERTESELDDPDELSALLAVLEPQVMASGQAVENQPLELAVAGRPLCSLVVSVLPQVDKEGRVCGVIGVGVDVSRVATLEQKLAQADNR